MKKKNQIFLRGPKRLSEGSQLFFVRARNVIWGFPDFGRPFGPTWGPKCYWYSPLCI